MRKRVGNLKIMSWQLPSIIKVSSTIIVADRMQNMIIQGVPLNSKIPLQTLCMIAIVHSMYVNAWVFEYVLAKYYGNCIKLKYVWVGSEGFIMGHYNFPIITLYVFTKYLLKQWLSSKVIETWPNTVAITNLMSYFTFPSSFDVKITFYCIKSLLCLFLQNWVGRTICNFIYLFVFLGNCKKTFSISMKEIIKNILCSYCEIIYHTKINTSVR